MGPYFVFVQWGWGEIQMFDFATVMEARAFYYGMREMMRRVAQMEEFSKDSYSDAIIAERVGVMFGDKAAQNYTRGVPRMTINWICADFNDVMSKNGVGHYTIYNTYMDFNGLKTNLEYALVHGPI